MTQAARTSTESAPSKPGQGNFDWTLHSPEEVGMSAEGLEGIRAAIQRHIDDGEISGAVTAVARHNKLVWFEAQGVTDAFTKAPMRVDDLFRMMSSTKPITAVAVLMMLQEGRLSLDDKVSRFLPGFKEPQVAELPMGSKDPAQLRIRPAERELTIKDLLTHTCGLSTYGLDMLPGAGAIVNKVQRGPTDTLADYVQRLGTAVLDFDPGSKWAYSPFDAFDVLLHIVEVASGVSADTFLRTRVFEPLDMRDACFNVPSQDSARLLPLYAKDGKSWKRQASLLTDEPTPYVSGAGGLFGTARDLLHFELMLLNRGKFNGHQILLPETVALMSEPHIGSMFADLFPPLTGGKAFGLGVAVVEDPTKGNGKGTGTFGWGGAYGTESWADPEHDVAAVIMVQRPDPGTVAVSFEHAIRAAITD